MGPCGRAMRLDGVHVSWSLPSYDMPYTAALTLMGAISLSLLARLRLFHHSTVPEGRRRLVTAPVDMVPSVPLLFMMCEMTEWLQMQVQGAQGLASLVAKPAPVFEATTAQEQVAYMQQHYSHGLLECYHTLYVVYPTCLAGLRPRQPSGSLTGGACHQRPVTTWRTSKRHHARRVREPTVKDPSRRHFRHDRR